MSWASRTAPRKSFHYANSATGKRSTVVLWRDEAARSACAHGDRMPEAIAVEQVIGNTAATRKALPTLIGLRLFARRSTTDIANSVDLP